MKAYRRNAWAADWILLGYCGLLIAIALIFHDRLPRWPMFVAGHLVIAGISILLVLGAGKYKIVRFLHDWDVAILLPSVFMLCCWMIHHVNPHDQDAALIRIDRAIGGIALLKMMESITAGWLTGVSKLLWLSYWVIPFVAAYPLWKRSDPRAFRNLKGMMVLGWTVSYALYFAVPAEGPGYHVAETGVANPKWEESPLSVVAKQVVDALEEEARDTFPSGHAIVAAICSIVLVLRRELKWAAVGVPMGVGIIFSTIYLRYHYLVDILAGLAIAGAIVVGWEVATARKARLESPPRDHPPQNLD